MMELDETILNMEYDTETNVLSLDLDQETTIALAKIGLLKVIDDAILQFEEDQENIELEEK